jgi:hypothetical protein
VKLGDGNKEKIKTEFKIPCRVGKDKEATNSSVAKWNRLGL